MSELVTPDYGADWHAMREWLIKTRGGAQQLAAAMSSSSPLMRDGFQAVARAGYEAQVEVLSSALDFMDERERAS